jgi:hypothetical protein
MATPCGVAKKHHITLIKGGFFGGLKAQIDMAAQIGKHIGHRHAGLFARGNGVQLHIGMLRQQAQELDPGITGATDDAGLDGCCGVCAHADVLSEKRKPACDTAQTPPGAGGNLNYDMSTKQKPRHMAWVFGIAGRQRRQQSEISVC